MNDIEQRLARSGILLPEPASPVATYVPYMGDGHFIMISGQLSSDSEGGIKGTVGADIDAAGGRAAARLCGINLLAQIRHCCDGDWSRLKQIVRLGGFVQTSGDFEAIPEVMNGCSDLMVEILGDVGRHARSAVGVYRLPLGFAVEVDAVIALRS